MSKNPRSRKVSAVPTSPSSPVSAWSELLDRVNQADAKALVELRQRLGNDPEGMVRAFGGDLAVHAQEMLIQTIAGQRITGRDGLLMKLDLLRAELSGPRPDPIERLLVERAVTCWLHVYYADCVVALTQTGAVARADFFERSQERAHRRYLSALKTLAIVRKLALPIRLDVNLAAIIRPPTVAEPAETCSP
jgi:hypothetical protein